MSMPLLDNEITNSNYGPEGHHHYTRQVQTTLDGLTNVVEMSKTALQSKGVAGPPIATYQKIQEGLQIATDAAKRAEAVFAWHLNRKAELRDNEALRGTQEGGYLADDEAR